MELIKKEKSWFLSEEGGKTFAALDSVGDRAVFIYSYLKNIANERFEKNNIIFKTAFLIADAVYNSDIEFSQYPNLLNEQVNPFIAFLKNAKISYSNEQIYCIYLAFVHSIADPTKKNEWIYSEKYFKDKHYLFKCEELGHMFVMPNESLLPDMSAYKCSPKLELIQLEIIWLFKN